MTGALLNGSLEQLNQFFEVVNAQVLVQNHAALLLNLLDDSLKRVNIGLVQGLHAKNNVTVHLYKATVAVPSEVGVVGLA